MLSDRWQRRRVLVITQILAMFQALTLACLTLTGFIQIWQLMVLAVFLGTVNSFDMPTRQAFTLEMVGRKEDLANAIALNSSLFNASRLIGPTLAGILIALVGEGTCFLLNGISYSAVIVGCWPCASLPRRNGPSEKNILQGLRVGVRYAFGFLPIRNILLLLALVSLVGMPYTILMPVFAKDILHGGPKTLGILMSGAGVGALAGAIYLAARKSVVGLSVRIPLAAACFGLGLIGLALSHQMIFSLPLMAVAGFGMMVNMASSNTILQTIAEEDKRGRLMSMYALAFAGMAPFGSLLARERSRPTSAYRPRLPAGDFSAYSERVCSQRNCRNCGRWSGHLPPERHPPGRGHGVGGRERADLGDAGNLKDVFHYSILIF